MTNPDNFLNRENIKGQRFLIISSVFTPDVIGGAEISAHNFASWLHKQGADVAILTTAKTPAEACRDVVIDGLRIWRVWMPRAYPQFHFAKAKWWQKPLWHLQDHLDPRNRAIVASVLDEFKPDFVHIHVLQGIGYNALYEIGKRNIKTTYILHDLGLACYRMGMFKNGKECKGQCTSCKISSNWKEKCAKTLPSLGFCSPSRANLNTLARYFPVEHWPATVIMNANRYPVPASVRTHSDKLRLLYVGRLHSSKGVHILLEAAAKLSSQYSFTLTLLGSGPDEQNLRAQYGNQPWCRFAGFVTQQDVSNYMNDSDLLCIPSIWAENSPGVVIQALGLGLPVAGSDKGGIPELIEHEKNGLLIPPGDVDAWCEHLSAVLSNPSALNPWRNYALEHAYKFAQDYLGNALLDFNYALV